MNTDDLAAEMHIEITAAFRAAVAQMFSSHVEYLCAFAKVPNAQAINESARVMGQAVAIAIRTEHDKARAAQKGLH
jgi:hypothetical protein